MGYGELAGLLGDLVESNIKNCEAHTPGTTALRYFEILDAVQSPDSVRRREEM